MNDFDNREETLFQQCLGLPPEKRERALQQLCPDDPDLRETVLGLIEAHEKSGGFMDSLPDRETAQAAARLQRSAPGEQSPGDQIGRYRLVELIGEGSWGSVWMAEQTEDIQRQVALKILKLGMDTKDFLTRFEAERQMLALMDHPNIAHVLDAGATSNGRPYFVMELVKGMPLLEYVDSKQLRIEERVELFVHICNAVQHAHQKGIIHRDLKPSNIMVTELDDEPVPKIIDFGVAKTTQFHFGDKPMFTGFHTFIGTPVYSSPEQLECSGMDVDNRSDIYGLGALLYELLCGQTPFDPEHLAKQSLESMREIIREQDPLKPSLRFEKLSPDEKAKIAAKFRCPPAKLQSRLRGDLDWIVMKCLEKDRSRRYETAHFLAHDLQAFLDQKPTSAAAPSVVYRTGKYIRRKQLSKVFWGAVPALMLGGLLFLLSLWINKDPSELRFTNQFVDPEKSIAVLPLVNLSLDPEDDFFAESVQEDILTNLSKIEKLQVIARNSTMGYKDTAKTPGEIAEELGVHFLVQGSVHRDDNRVMVRVQLIDAETEAELWAENYNRDLGDIFKTQSEIAREIATQLKANLSPEAIRWIERHSTENLQAYNYYVKARYLIESTTQRGDEKIELLEKAVERDPEFVEAWAQLAVECIYWWNVDRQRNDPELLKKARNAISEAKRTGPDLPHLFYAQSSLAMNERADIEASRDLAIQALLISAGFQPAQRVLGMRYRQLGSLLESQHSSEQAVRNDPLSSIANGSLNETYQLIGLWDESHALIQTMQQQGVDEELWSRKHVESEYLQDGDKEALIDGMNSLRGFSERHEGKVWLALQSRNYQAALNSLDDMELGGTFAHLSGDLSLEIRPITLVSALIYHELKEISKWKTEAAKARSNLEDLMEGDPLDDPNILSNLALCHALEGQRDLVESTVQKVRDLTASVNWNYRSGLACETRIAMAYLVLGDHDKTIETMEAASKMDGSIFLNRELDLWFIFDRLRGDPRFDKLLAGEG